MWKILLKCKKWKKYILRISGFKKIFRISKVMELFIREVFEKY
jgi:hypothetical protein